MARKKQKHSLPTKLAALAAALLLVLAAPLAGRLGLTEDDLFPILNELYQVFAPETPAPNAEGQVTVAFIDVGQGDSILIAAPQATVLIDGGTPANGSTVYSFLQQQGVTRLDYIINTHPDSDHVGGLAQVVKKLGSGSVGQVLVTSYPAELEPNNQSWPQLLQQAEEYGAQLATAQTGSVYDLGGGAQLTLLGPVELYDDINEDSIVCRLDFGEASFLFTGDSSTRALRDSAEAGYSLESDLLKLGHHGSRTSTDSVVLRLADPKAAVASCGEDNSYGHPHTEVVELLAEQDIPCLRTDLQGTITAVTDGSTITITAERGQAEPLVLDAAA